MPSVIVLGTVSHVAYDRSCFVNLTLVTVFLL
jgi:hypothetical protein